MTAIEARAQAFEQTTRTDAWSTLSARNLARFWEVPQRAMGRSSMRGDDVWASDSESRNPFPNSATLTRPLAIDRAAEVVERVRSFFEERRGGPWLLWSAWDTPDLTRFGLQLAGRPPLMVREPWQAMARACPPELEIREVTDSPGASDWLTTL